MRTELSEEKKSPLPGEILEGLDYFVSKGLKNAHGMAHDICGDTVCKGKPGESRDSRAIQARIL